MSGDDTLWNKCGDDKHLSQTLKKILNGWYGDPSSTLRSTTPYTLDMFYVPKEAQLWLDGAYKPTDTRLGRPFAEAELDEGDVFGHGGGLT